MNENQKSPHILNAASNLLGFCFIVLTSLKVLKVGNDSLVDELTAATILLLMISLICSFFFIRSGKRYWERGADISFLLAIFGLFLTTLYITFGLVK